MIRRTALASALLAAAFAPSTGCWATNPDTPVIEAEDVSMDVAAGSFRRAGERGDVYSLAIDVSTETNGWVTDVAVGMSAIVRELNHYPEDHTTDDGWRVYGPHDDDDGRDSAWMARIKGDEGGSSFEVYIGRRGMAAEQMELLIDGMISVDAEQRDGEFTIDFDTIHAFADVLDHAREDARYGGSIAVTFERDLDSRHKRVEMDFAGFHFDDGEDDLDFDGEHYTYRREADGAGQFHFGARSSFEGVGWSGPKLERMQVDMIWDADHAGRARGVIAEIDGEGDLWHGDVHVHECFDARGGLTWRSINEPYATYEPTYSFGEETSCVRSEDDLMKIPE